MDAPQLTLRTLTRFGRCEAGASAGEFALVLPAILFLMFGAFNLLVVVYAAASLQAAAEASARYASIQTNLNGSAPSQATVQTYAASAYKGPGLSSLAFTCAGGSCAASGCGHSVSATGTYKLSYGFGALTVPINAQACFP